MDQFISGDLKKLFELQEHPAPGYPVRHKASVPRIAKVHGLPESAVRMLLDPAFFAEVARVVREYLTPRPEVSCEKCHGTGKVRR